MRNTKRKSPFEKLICAIEEEYYNSCLIAQSDEELNRDFLLGYRSTINSILLNAYGIYHQHTIGGASTLDLSSAKTSELLLKELKRD